MSMVRRYKNLPRQFHRQSHHLREGNNPYLRDCYPMSIFHYPISPKIAVELMIVPKFSAIASVSKNMVLELEQELVGVVKNCNRKLVENCVNEIYSNTEKSLAEFQGNLAL